MPHPRKSLLRSLGEFFGHIRHGVKTDLSSRKVVRHDVQEERRGNITLRRTIVEEVEIRPPADGEPDPRPQDG